MSKVYFFKEDQYYRFDTKKDSSDDRYPKSIAQHWSGLPATGIDAAINWGNGKSYFFVGDEYYRFDAKMDQVDQVPENPYPRKIASNWKGLTLDRVDACVRWDDEWVYFFRGNDCWRYNTNEANEGTDRDYPKNINHEFGDDMFHGYLDGGINWGNGKIYFFKGDWYVRYDIQQKTVEHGWPKRIDEQWPGLPNNVRAPIMLGFAGIDRLEYPGDNTMEQLWESTNLTWTGFYLAPAPSQQYTGWMNRFRFLRDMGWGIAPIYVGQQQPEPTHPSPGSHIVTAAQGTLDADDAIQLARTAGIPAGSVLYLDIETGGPIQPGLIEYYRSWVQAVASGGFRPGVYCSYLLTNEFFVLDSRPEFWTFNINQFRNGQTATYSDPFPAPEPMYSLGVISAAWQLAQNAVLNLGGNSVQPMDFDSCSMRNPSQFP